MITIRGENVYPIEVDNFLGGLPGTPRSTRSS